MARLVGSEFLSMLRDMLGGENSSTLSDDRLMRFINQSYLEVCSFVKPHALSGSETVTTSNGTGEYTFSSDNVLVVDDCINATNNQPVYVIDEHQYNQFNLGGSTTGTPVYYFESGASAAGLFMVTLWPTPNGVYSLEFDIIKKPTELVHEPASASIGTVIPETWDDSILYRAAFRGWMSLGDTARAKEYRQAAAANDGAAFSVTNTESEVGENLISQVGVALNRA